MNKTFARISYLETLKIHHVRLFQMGAHSVDRYEGQLLLLIKEILVKALLSPGRKLDLQETSKTRDSEWSSSNRSFRSLLYNFTG